jgi:hypothetical protein
MRQEEKPKGGFMGSVVWTLVVLVAVNTAPVWRHWTDGVVLSSWTDALWAMNVSLGAQLVGNVLLTPYHPDWFYRFMQAVFGAASLLVTIVFLVVFPLDFSVIGAGWANTLARALVIAGICGSGLSLIVNLARFITSSRRGDPDVPADARSSLGKGERHV